jgi:hypothetical protein
MHGTYNVKMQVSLNTFPTDNDVKEEDAWPPLLFSFASEYAILIAQVTEKGLKLNGANGLVVYADYVKLLHEDMHAIKGKTDASSVDIKKVCSEVNIQVSSEQCSKRHEYNSQ